MVITQMYLLCAATTNAGAVKAELRKADDTVPTHARNTEHAAVCCVR